MTTDVNKESRKRKSTSDLIFEVDEADVSPSITPEPTAEIESGEVSETETSQISTDTSKISEDVIIKTEEIKKKQKIEINFDELNGKLEYEMTSNNIKTNAKTNESDLDSSLKPVETGGATRIKENIVIKKDNIKEDIIIKRIVNEPKTDADLQCVDMEVANSPPPAINTEKPFVSLIFRDKNAALRMEAKVVHYIKSVIDYELNIKLTPFSSDYAIDFWEDKIEENVIQKAPKTNIKESIKLEHEFENLDLFVVDTTPSKKQESLPRYLPTSQCETLGEKEPIKVDNSVKCRTATCFNCDGDHAIKDCKKARNQRRITLARNRFRSQQKNTYTRYHVEDEVKFNHIAAGKISDELRRALDVRKHELPPYIYRMRTLGYPPGWLQEAMISNSKLELFDFQGCAIQDGGGDCNSKIDPNKVVEYAGFNAPLEKGFKDEFKYYNCPPYNEKYSKSCMVQYIEQISENIVVKTEIVQKPNAKEIKATESDSNSQESQSTEKIRRSESPTLTDLELRKKQLLAELEDGGLNSPQPNSDTSLIINDKTNPIQKDITESPNVVSSSMGTPVLKSSSPFIQLPEPDKFSKDISQVINFENLPDSTGKYEQMTVVINKVRKTVKNSKS